MFIVNSNVIFPFSIDPLTFGFATVIIRHVKAVGVEKSVNKGLVYSPKLEIIIGSTNHTRC